MIVCLSSVWTTIIVYAVLFNTFLLIGFYFSESDFKQMMIITVLFQIVLLLIVPLLLKGLSGVC